MASDMHPKGSWILRILIVILVICLLTSINYPRKLWDKQEQLITDSRERMENLNYIVQRYRTQTGYYQADLDSLISFMNTDSLVVNRPIFELERLSLFDSDSDSFLIGFIDLFHFERLEAEQVTEDSIVLSMIPKPIFADLLMPVKMAMSGPKGVQSFERGKGDHDIYHILWSRGKINRYDISYDSLHVASRQYLLYRGVDEVDTDPITGERYHLGLNTRITVQGQVDYTMLKEDEPDPAILDNELMTNMLVNKLARAARAKLDATLKRDTTLYDQQMALQSDFFEMELNTLNPRSAEKIEGDREIICSIDSVHLYHDEARIKKELFHTVYDSLIRVWTEWPQLQEKFAKITYAEQYGLTKIDTIGVVISPPFGDEFKLPPEGILDRIFSVGPIDNPGNIENNDLSWEEKK